MALTHHYLRASNAAAAAQLIATTLLTTNRKDYTADYLAATIAKLQPQDLVDKATWTHFYVFYEGTELVGTGRLVLIGEKLMRPVCSIFSFHPSIRARELAAPS